MLDLLLEFNSCSTVKWNLSIQQENVTCLSFSSDFFSFYLGRDAAVIMKTQDSLASVVFQSDLSPSEHERRPVLHQQQRAHHHHRVCKLQLFVQIIRFPMDIITYCIILQMSATKQNGKINHICLI